MEKYLMKHKDTPPFGIEGDYRCSVHYDDYRIKKAKQQAQLKTVEVEKIIFYIEECLGKLKIKLATNEYIYNPDCVDYEKIKRDNQLDRVEDIVWIKFSSDGYIGVVCATNDINFDIPSSNADYNKKMWIYNTYLKKRIYTWKHTSSGILLHQLGKEWDTSFVLIIPIPKLSEKGLKIGDVEMAIGNYLIDQEVPILDFYSHNY